MNQEGHSGMSFVQVKWAHIVRQSEQKHTSGSIQDSWNSWPAWFRLHPDPPCWLRQSGDKLYHSTQWLAYSTCNGEDVGWQGIEVKLGAEESQTGDSWEARYANLVLLPCCKHSHSMLSRREPYGMGTVQVLQMKQHLEILILPKPSWEKAQQYRVSSQ